MDFATAMRFWPSLILQITSHFISSDSLRSCTSLSSFNIPLRHIKLATSTFGGKTNLSVEQSDFVYIMTSRRWDTYQNILCQ